MYNILHGPSVTCFILTVVLFLVYLARYDSSGIYQLNWTDWLGWLGVGVNRMWDFSNINTGAWSDTWIYKGSSSRNFVGVLRKEKKPHVHIHTWCDYSRRHHQRGWEQRWHGCTTTFYGDQRRTADMIYERGRKGGKWEIAMSVVYIKEGALDLICISCISIFFWSH